MNTEERVSLLAQSLAVLMPFKNDCLEIQIAVENIASLINDLVCAELDLLEEEEE